MDEEMLALQQEQDERKRKEEQEAAAEKAAAGTVMTGTVESAVQQAGETYWKPADYNRKMFEDKSAMDAVKNDAFAGKETITDSYTGKEIFKTQAEALQAQGNIKYSAETDHVNPEKTTFERLKKNPYLTSDDIKEIINCRENFQVTSRASNNAKRDRSNKEFVNDKEYQKKTGVELTEEGKQQAIADQERATRKQNELIVKKTVKNVAVTYTDAAVEAGREGAACAATISIVHNVVAVIEGEKTSEEAIVDVAETTVVAGVSCGATGGTLAVIQHALENSSSEFLRALAESNVPGKVLTGIAVAGDAICKWVNGEISTTDCLLQIGDKGMGAIITGASVMMGQTLIPIPVVGSMVGAFVGVVLSKFYSNNIFAQLQKTKQHTEAMRQLQAYYNQLAEEERRYREQLEQYLNVYLADYCHCLDSALDELRTSIYSGDADGAIAAANKITRKVGGRVAYENCAEAKAFFLNSATDKL